MTEQNINEHLRANAQNPFKVVSSVSPSIEIISSKKLDFQGADDLESAATNDTSGSAGSKRKRVRHRKKKTNVSENVENQMNLSNVNWQFIPGEPRQGGILKHDTTEKSFSNKQSKSNIHVR